MKMFFLRQKIFLGAIKASFKISVIFKKDKKMQKNKIKVVKKTLQERKTATVFREKKTVFAGAVIANNPDYYPKRENGNFSCLK